MITYIATGAFSGLTSLKTLNLVVNALTSISFTAFNVLASLGSLYRRLLLSVLIHMYIVLRMLAANSQLTVLPGQFNALNKLTDLYDAS